MKTPRGTAPRDVGGENMITGKKFHEVLEILKQNGYEVEKSPTLAHTWYLNRHMIDKDDFAEDGEVVYLNHYAWVENGEIIVIDLRVKDVYIKHVLDDFDIPPAFAVAYMRKIRKKLRRFALQRIPHKPFKFGGTCHGDNNGFPKEVGTYDTVRYGKLSYFLKGAEKVQEDGTTWVKIHEYYSVGDAAVPDTYYAIYVPEQYVDEIKEWNLFDYVYIP